MEPFEPKKRIIILCVPKMSKFQKCPSSKNVFFPKCRKKFVETVA